MASELRGDVGVPGVDEPRAVDARGVRRDVPERLSLAEAYRDDAEDIFDPVADGDSAGGRQPDLYSRSPGRSNRDLLDNPSGLDATTETVRTYAEQAGVDLRDVAVEVADDPDVIRYLDYVGAMARTDALGIQLGPAAFVDEETLVRALAHERVHVTQYREGRVDTDTQRLEDEAYAAEDAVVERWRGAES